MPHPVLEHVYQKPGRHGHGPCRQRTHPIQKERLKGRQSQRLMYLRQQHQEPASIDMLNGVGPYDAARPHRVWCRPRGRRTRQPTGGESLAYQEDLRLGKGRHVVSVGCSWTRIGGIIDPRGWCLQIQMCCMNPELSTAVLLPVPQQIVRYSYGNRCPNRVTGGKEQLKHWGVHGVPKNSSRRCHCIERRL